LGKISRFIEWTRQNSAAKKVADQIRYVFVEVCCHVPEDSMKRADPQFFMGWNGDVVFPTAHRRSKANVASGLARYLVSVTA
jgi:hypothetical protein